MTFRALLRRRRVQISAYTVLLYLGLLAGTYTAYGGARAEGLHGRELGAVILLLLAVAVLGARLAFVAGRRSLFRRTPRRILARNEGGAVAYGSLLAVPLSAPILAALGIPFGAFWDAGALGFLAATVFLRIGCLVNGCCPGKVSESRFAVELCDARGVRARRVPTQLLEAGWAAVVFAGATPFVHQMPFTGALFLLVLAAYALGRFVLDFARDARRTVGPFTFAQSSSASLVFLSLSLFAIVLLN